LTLIIDAYVMHFELYVR